MSAGVVHELARTGRADRQALHRLARSLHRLDAADPDGLDGELTMVSSGSLGGAHVLAQLWERLGVAPQLRELVQEREFESNFE
jgi:hypothetical protein